MQWIASIWASVIYIFELAQTEQDISRPCVKRSHYSSEAATPERYIK